LKKLVLLAALLAMVLATAVPAIAQVTQTPEQGVESGDSSQTGTVTGGGDNSNACQGIQGISNTGNAVTNTNVLQYASDGSEVEVDDSGNFAISPSSTTTCKSDVNQAASASAH
jgi:phosphodiesterase/alkaline phosphatase D-like protein